MLLSLLSDLPQRPESTIAGAIEALRTRDPLVRQIASSLEAPSAIAVVREIFLGVTHSFEEIPQPDPRIPWEPVPFVLWRYEGVKAHPALPPAPPAVNALVTGIAERPYALAGWSRAASLAADAAGDAVAAQIVAPMVHPPPAPAGTAPWDWRFRVQVAAALLLAHVEERSGRSALPCLGYLVRGPVDWTATAAIVAHLDVTRRHPAQAHDVAAELLRFAGRPLSPIWSMCVELPALLAVMDIGGLPESVYATVRKRIEAHNA